jgi:hypothetical protein
VRDAGDAVERIGLQLAREIVELALGPPPLELAVVDRADAGRVIAAIFEPLEPVEQPLRDIAFPTIPTIPHITPPLSGSSVRGSGLAQPAMPFCSLRSTARLSASTSSVITDPAPTIAPSPIVTGATSAVFEPMNAPAPITVRYLPNPS